MQPVLSAKHFLQVLVAVSQVAVNGESLQSVEFRHSTQAPFPEAAAVLHTEPLLQPELSDKQVLHSPDVRSHLSCPPVMHAESARHSTQRPAPLFPLMSQTAVAPEQPAFVDRQVLQV